MLLDQDQVSVDDLAELEAAVEESAAQFERGEIEDARAFAVELAAKSSGTGPKLDDRIPQP